MIIFLSNKAKRYRLSMELFVVVDFFGVGYLTGTEEKKSNQRVEVLWDLNGEILSEV